MCKNFLRFIIFWNKSHNMIDLNISFDPQKNFLQYSTAQRAIYIKFYA